MQTRLAFAVAAHLEPEILLVDEVLAVGDARFQRKCLNKMQDVGQAGRTVIFVSHQMPAITRLCERAILLEGGTLRADGPAHQVVSAYLNSGLGTTARREWDEPAQRPGGEIVRLCAVRIREADGIVSDTIDIRQSVAVEMEYDVLTAGYAMMPHFHFYNEEGTHVFSAHDTDATWLGRQRPVGHYVSTARIPGNLLTEGMLFVDAGLVTLDPVIGQFLERHTIAFQVTEHLEGLSARGAWGGRMRGVVRPLLQWETQCDPWLYAEVSTTCEKQAATYKH
jgi:lipopolysaccharide transport system ATP-binding protein